MKISWLAFHHVKSFRRTAMTEDFIRHCCTSPMLSENSVLQQLQKALKELVEWLYVPFIWDTPKVA